MCLASPAADLLVCALTYAPCQLFEAVAVCRAWRRAGKRLFFAQPWDACTTICHPLQLYSLVSRKPMGCHDCWELVIKQTGLKGIGCSICLLCSVSLRDEADRVSRLDSYACGSASDVHSQGLGAVHGTCSTRRCCQAQAYFCSTRCGAALYAVPVDTQEALRCWAQRPRQRCQKQVRCC